VEDYQHATSKFNSSKDGFSLFYQQWQPLQWQPLQWQPQKVERIIVFQHGLGEHSGRYQNLVEAFSGTSTAFYGLDARGHGQTGGKRGHIHSLQLFINDLHDLIQRAQRENDGQKVFLLGHSMGGTTALSYAITDNYQEGLRGLIISAPGIEVVTDWAKKLQKQAAALLSSVAPSFTLATRLNYTNLSHDPAVVAAFLNDPLVHDRASAHLGDALFNAPQTILERASSIQIPVYLLHGTDDQLAIPSGSKKLYNLLTTPDKTLKLYEGMYHEPINERLEDREKVLDDLREWVLAH